ncbi:MAG: ABC transporter permease [Candidatus Pacebacteria bacterium]|nr:ABC transporter permease [Candidatus Paceibacterota bacterium]
MVSPKFQKVSSDQLSVSGQTKKLFQAIYFLKQQNEAKPEDISRIRVSALISKVAFFYEKIRNAVDYDEEHLLRKNAIERILKRQIVIEGVLKASKSEEISLHLITELIRAGYLPNNEIPEAKIKEIGQLLEKYIKLKSFCLDKISTFSDAETDTKIVKNKIKERSGLVSWLISLAATEIEENLGYNNVQRTIVQNMYDDLEKNIQAQDKLQEIYKKDLKIQIYLSIFRKHLKYNDSMLSLILFRYYNSTWTKNNISDEEIYEIAYNIKTLQAAIARQLNHPLIKQIDNITKKYSVFYQILTETIGDKPVKLYNEVRTNAKVYYQKIKETYSQKYKRMKKSLWRSALRSIIYIFLTKSIFVILIEVPAIRWFNEEINYLALFINITFPALLLFIMVLLTRKPSTKNLEAVVEGVQEVTYNEHKRTRPFFIAPPAKRRPVVNFVYNLIYTTTFLFTAYLFIRVLLAINFNWVSITIFLFFLAFVSFFSIRVKKNVKELIIAERKDNLADFLFDFFYMPIVATGRWLSDKASKVNIFIFILDFVIEAPFKVFVEIAEDWTKYVKERKEDIM